METSRISLDRIKLASQVIDPVFLNSPQYAVDLLNQKLGVELILKVESINPIRSFKGRGAEFLLSQVYDDRPLLCASAGNFGQAMAYACRKRNRKITVFAATTANPFKVERMRSLGARMVLFGEDFDAAKNQARDVARQEGYRMVEDGLDVETVEGAGTIGLELVSLDNLDVLLVALGNGALFNGIATVFKALRPTVKRIAVQASGAPAMAESWRTGTLVTHPAIHTIADGIGVRVPIPEALADMQPLADDVITVEEGSILEAMNLIYASAGIVSEPSGAVGVAALLEHRERFAGLKVVTVICGGNLTDTQRRQWLH
ncbi:MAG: pyridoxal-phosphate dependent enzyme [Cyclobacteriaceae bacterium]|nr:pyridoxal-phosphate dependent enzyme [Cyclobacteriaceae bacterium]